MLYLHMCTYVNISYICIFNIRKLMRWLKSSLNIYLKSVTSETIEVVYNTIQNPENIGN